MMDDTAASAPRFARRQLYKNDLPDHAVTSTGSLIPLLQIMKLTFFIALFALPLASIGATGHGGGKMPHQGDLTLAHFQALLDSESMSQYGCVLNPKFATNTPIPQ